MFRENLARLVCSKSSYLQRVAHTQMDLIRAPFSGFQPVYAKYRTLDAEDIYFIKIARKQYMPDMRNGNKTRADDSC